jgi:hypothetical protein
MFDFTENENNTYFGMEVVNHVATYSTSPCQTQLVVPTLAPLPLVKHISSVEHHIQASKSNKLASLSTVPALAPLPLLKRV